MLPFVPGLSLSSAFFHGLVAPIIEGGFPDLRFSAALIGSGSEVLGYDTEMSSDHHWGPRVMIFLTPGDHARHCHSNTGRAQSSSAPPILRDTQLTSAKRKVGEGDSGTQIPQSDCIRSRSIIASKS